jgi:hypothetical protein
MSETTLLRNNAIRNNASVGAQTPGPVKTGELPNVQVKPVAAAPQVRQSQQQNNVQVLAPNSKGAVTTGNLPMVQIKMGQNGPQPDNGQESPVVIKDHKQQTVATGQLPMVQVKMDGGKPKVQTMSNVQGGPPRIATPAPALSAPRVAQPGVMRVAAPAPQIVAPPLPEVPELSTDELMICQHALAKYIDALQQIEGSDVEDSEAFGAIKLAKEASDNIDQILVAITIRNEAAANAAAAAETAPIPAPAPVAAAGGYTAPRAVTGGYYSPAALSPQGHAQVQAQQAAPQQPVAVVPSAPRSGGYVMQQSSVRRTQLTSGLAPRGVRRAPAGNGLPMVQVKMDGQRPTVLNQAELEAAKAAREAQAQPVETVVETANDLPQQG